MRIEKKTIKFHQGLLTLFAVCTIRNIEESILNHQQILDNPNSEWRTLITVFFHYNFFWLFAFGLLVLLVYAFTRKQNTIRNVLAIGLYSTPIIFLPPILNVLLGDNSSIGYPPNPKWIIEAIPNFLNPKYIIPGVTIGIRWEGVITGLAGAFYIHYKTKKIWKSLLGFLLIPLLIALTGSLIPILCQLYENGFHFSDELKLYECALLNEGTLGQTASQQIALLYIFLTGITALCVISIHNKRLLISFLRNIRGTRSLHYLILYFGGFFLAMAACHIDYGFSEHCCLLKENLATPFDYFVLFMGGLSLFFAFQGAVVFNDFYDAKIDLISNKNRPLTAQTIPVNYFKAGGYLLFTVSLCIAICISESMLFIIMANILLSYLYSIPPFRCRKSLLLSNLIIALEAILAFASGACIFVQSAVFQVIPTKLILSLLLAFFLITPYKDIKDYKGDKQSHINTLLTLFGEKTGTLITIILISIVIIGLPSLLGIHTFYWISIPIGITFVLLSLLARKRQLNHESFTFPLYFIYLLSLFYKIYHLLLLNIQ